MNRHHESILRGFQAEEPGRGSVSRRPEHRGISRRWHGLKNAQTRRVLLDFIAAHKGLGYDEWLGLIDSLYHGDSYEERCSAGTLFRGYPRYRRRLPLGRLDAWLGCLEGWAEVDSTCQTVFSAEDMLADWEGWRGLLESLAADENVNKRRASLVLLTGPIAGSDDARVLELSLRLIDGLKGEKDKLITKAVSWLLRRGIKLHRGAIADYVDANAESLPSVAVRETRRKLETGKK